MLEIALKVKNSNVISPLQWTHSAMNAVTKCSRQGLVGPLALWFLRGAGDAHESSQQVLHHLHRGSISLPKLSFLIVVNLMHNVNEISMNKYSCTMCLCSAKTFNGKKALQGRGRVKIQMMKNTSAAAVQRVTLLLGQRMQSIFWDKVRYSALQDKYLSPLYLVGQNQLFVSKNLTQSLFVRPS